MVIEFIGGRLDGEIREVPNDGIMEYRVPIAPQICFTVEEEGKMSEEIIFKEEVYKRKKGILNKFYFEKIL